MNKKSLALLVLLMMLILVVAGCGKKSPNDPPKGPPTLEGTWKVIEKSVTVNGVKDENESQTFPLDVEGIMTVQAYGQFKNGKYMRYMKILDIKGEIPPNAPEHFKNAKVGDAVLLGTENYTVNGNEIILDDGVYTFAITDNTLTMTKTEAESSTVTVQKFVKVSDSELAVDPSNPPGDPGAPGGPLGTWKLQEQTNESGTQTFPLSVPVGNGLLTLDAYAQFKDGKFRKFLKVFAITGEIPSEPPFASINVGNVYLEEEEDYTVNGNEITLSTGVWTYVMTGNALTMTIRNESGTDTIHQYGKADDSEVANAIPENPFKKEE